MTVSLWAMQIRRPLTEAERSRLMELLPPVRRERLVRLKIREKQEEVLCAYGLLAWALRQRLGWQSLPEMCLTEQGKPFFSAFPSIHFSISHTEGAVMVGVSETSVGVDLEKIRPVSRRLRERFSADTAEAFFELWVRREARGKCSGQGIGSMLRQEPPMGTDEWYDSFEPFPGYAAGAAGLKMNGLPVCQVVSLEEIL